MGDIDTEMQDSKFKNFKFILEKLYFRKIFFFKILLKKLKNLNVQIMQILQIWTSNILNFMSKLHNS